MYLMPKYTPSPRLITPAAPAMIPNSLSVLPGSSDRDAPEIPKSFVPVTDVLESGPPDPVPVPGAGSVGGVGAGALHTFLSSTGSPSWIWSSRACAVAYGTSAPPGSWSRYLQKYFSASIGF